MEKSLSSEKDWRSFIFAMFIFWVGIVCIDNIINVDRRYVSFDRLQLR